MLRSLRSRLILASVLWTAGLLALMHMFSLFVIHIFPGMRTVHAWWPVLGGVFLMAAGLFGLRQGLTPFRRLRERLMAVRMGDDRRVEGVYPERSAAAHRRTERAAGRAAKSRETRHRNGGRSGARPEDSARPAGAGSGTRGVCKEIRSWLRVSASRWNACPGR